MSQQNNTTDTAKFRHDFGWDPQPFQRTLNIYAAQL
jgi:hypothetical protein